MQLDRTDVEILKMLQMDSRASFRDIAKKTGVSVPTISARVERLEKLGVLRGYHADLDVDKLNEQTLLVLVRSAPQAVNEVAAQLCSMEQVRKLFILRGSRLMGEVVLGGPRSVDGFLESLAKIPGVVEYDHFISTSRLKDEPSAIVEDSLVAVLQCFECHKMIEGEPVRKKMDGKDHYFCCRSCEKLYVEKYRKIKAGV